MHPGKSVCHVVVHGSHPYSRIETHGSGPLRFSEFHLCIPIRGMTPAEVPSHGGVSLSATFRNYGFILPTAQRGGSWRCHSCGSRNPDSSDSQPTPDFAGATVSYYVTLRLQSQRCEKTTPRLCKGALTTCTRKHAVNGVRVAR